jgi:hypothetical protein
MSAPAAFLETERMYFRRFQDADAQLLYKLDGDPDVMRFTRAEFLKSNEQRRP